MSPDARLIAASNLLTASMLRPFSENSPPYDAERIAEDVLELELTLGDSGKPEPGIRGMVPVALVKDWLTGIRGRAEALPFGAEHLPQLGDLLEHLGKIRAQLETL